MSSGFNPTLHSMKYPREMSHGGILYLMDNEGPDPCVEIRQAIKRTEPGDRARQEHIMAEAINKGCFEDIPDDWEVDVNG